MLPEVSRYKPSGTGEPPLANAGDWLEVTLPDGRKAKRETNTMPQWAGSCWYYLRYMDPQNPDAPFDPEKQKYWLPVDLYIGGAEHAVLHLLYSRFWHKLLFDLGYVDTPEPYQKLINQGMILGEDGQKMSKSRGNVVNPDDVIRDYGADSMRLYEMFMGPLEASKPWNMNGVEGVHRFLTKAWKMIVDGNGELSADIRETAADQDTTRLLHQTIKKVTGDIEEFSFNTAISQMMIFINGVSKLDVKPKTAIEKFVLLLAPFSPHIAEELWSKLGNTQSLAYEPWPQYDEELTKESSIEIAVQVLGKIKDRIKVPADLDEKGLEQAALASEKIQSIIAGKQVRKVIVVKGRLVNIIAN
jgi:leucyl-tRNA synthetase